ncbi:2-deoxy-scyllo-inosamine dehydrogenase [Luteitalea pratensis]|uniref:2-deoxy-scyllo-inosamine dehydrogenase n=1 Tax=Luteitalea pratensis TaxID=1855912 RepID=A0A143PIC1_LUTPR|nr:alcohol dehydrogenase catalytic domain-containing protein [Luteitalea pratensis]AMY07514.1 2-deoxy-scyllo-inosamine dehydrogenase [Luteitalea pratensis]
MHGVCFRAPGVVAWEDVIDPAIQDPADAVVGVDLAGLCGSDLHPFFGREQGLDPGTVMGHEFVGRVLDVGPAVRSVRPGDHVYAPFSTSCGQCAACRSALTSRCECGQLFGWRSDGVGLHGGQAERVRVPLADGTLQPVPAGLSVEAALLLGDNFSTACYCADMAGIQPDGVTVVIGCGSVGVLGIIAATLAGARTIVAVDPVPERRARAAALGAVAMAPGPDVARTVAALGHGRGADSVMEFVGLPAAQRLAWEVLRPGGVMAVIGCHTSAFAFSPSEAYDKNLTYRTGRCPARHYMERLTERVMQDLPHITQVVTHRFAPSDCVRAYDVFAHQRDGCVKAVFDFA